MSGFARRILDYTASLWTRFLSLILNRQGARRWFDQGHAVIPLGYPDVEMDTKDRPLSASEEDQEIPLKERLTIFMDSKNVQIFMTIVTIFALYGDDFRIFATYKAADPAFYVSFIVALVLLVIELSINSVILEDYKWSFFFWLDCVATVSLIPDIGWITDFLASLYEIGDSMGQGGGGQSGVARAGRASRAGSRAGRIVRLVRLVRLLRVVNLAKLFRSELVEDDWESCPLLGRALAGSLVAFSSFC
ncbi:hypothetical protein FOZ62_014769 [Perkinsus olseni]|uniref:Ion transport domain-containing protein n=1 Tax=Perkinsus olseni TaxID=32597 RepID=A0A7J6SDS5_PEROL|nr:hypothetical protein FOZ62_014769 [Perkinsus olseni]